MRVLVIDNYDSFTYNLVQYLGELGAEVEVVRNDKATVEELLERGADRLVVSPGPCTPDEAGISIEAIRASPRPARPSSASASATSRWSRPSAAASSAATRSTARTPRSSTTARTIFAGLPSPLVAGRYHSLVADPRPARRARADARPTATS